MDTSTTRINGCDTGIARFSNPGLLIGANLVANENVCRVAANGNRVRYLSCMNNVADDLRGLGPISSADRLKVRTCATKAGTL